MNNSRGIKATVALVFGVVFVLIGLLGFVNNPVLGLFQVDTLHNLIHITSGLFALLYGIRSESNARNYGLIFGVVYALVTIIGIFTANGGPLLGLIAANTADTYLHLVLTIGLLALGLVPTDAKVEAKASM